MRIRISWHSGQVVASLSDTPESRRLLHTLPYSSPARTWGDEVYFRVPVQMAPFQDARDVVEPGEVCYWLGGQSLAIPFGPTPIAEAGECRMVDKVNVLGRVETDPRCLSAIRDGDTVRITRVADTS